MPHRPLKPDADKSVGKPKLDGNLIVHGDNLHALKSLLLMYAGKVNCVYIDPPYNTGSEGWHCNDNVNSPAQQGTDSRMKGGGLLYSLGSGER